MIDTVKDCQIKLDQNKITIDDFQVKFNLTNLMSEETFGKWLLRQRKRCEFNQTELAKLARVSKNYISLLEADKIVQPRLSSIDKIAKALNLTPDAARRQLVADQVKLKSYSNDQLSSIDFLYKNFKTDEARHEAEYLFKLLNREIERITEEEQLRLAGNDATVDEAGDKKIRITKKDIFREGS